MVNVVDETQNKDLTPVKYQRTILITKVSCLGQTRFIEIQGKLKEMLVLKEKKTTLACYQ